MRPRPRHPRLRVRAPLAAALVALAAVSLTACAGDDGSAGQAATDAPVTVTVTEGDGGAVTTATTPSTGSGATTTAASTASATLWFMNSEGVLVGETREGAGGSVRNALTALAEGPSDPSLVPVFPVGSSVVGTDLEGDVVVVEVDQAFEDGYPSGGAAELATMAPIVYTATGFPGVSAVRMEVAGEPLAPPTAQLDFSVPLTRADVQTETVAPEVDG